MASTSAPLQSVMRFSVTSTNGSADDIIGLSVDWTITDATGATTHRVSASEMSKTPTGFGLARGQTLLATPMCIVLSSNPIGCPMDSTAVATVAGSLHSAIPVDIVVD